MRPPHRLPFEPQPCHDRHRTISCIAAGYSHPTAPLPRLLSILLSLLLLFAGGATGRAQASLSFGSDFLPTATLTENYTDTVILGDFGYEQRPDTALTINARVSMKDVVIADMVAEDSVASISIGNLQLDLPLANATATTLNGRSVLTWDLPSTDPSTGEPISAGSVVISYTSVDLTLKIVAADDPRNYSVYAAAEAGSDETLSDFPSLFRFSVGPYGVSDSTLYLNGPATVFDKTVGTGDNQQTFYNLAKVNLTGEIDSTYPSVSFTSPVSKATVSDRPLTVTGRYSDKHGVFTVEFQVNDGGYAPASLDKGVWTMTGVELAVGGNTLAARCTDLDGHVKIVTARVNFTLTSNLTVNADGNAPGRLVSTFFTPIAYAPPTPSVKSVSKHKDGDALIITAVPGIGAVFDGWTTSGTLTARQLASPVLSFRHQPNLKLTANFLINPFTPVKGLYNGLISGATPMENGLLSLRLGNDGTFTGSITTSAVTLRLKGKFSNRGAYTTTIKVGTISYTITLALNVSGAGEQKVTGTVVGGGLNLNLDSDRVTYDSRTSPAPQKGTYNVILPPDAGQSATYPVGIGFGRVMVSANGSVRFVGRLASGPAFNAAAQLTPTGKWPFYAPLYGKKGSITGPITFDLSNPAHDLTGPLVWIKPPNIKTVPVYPAGFTGQSTLTGSRFVAPAIGQRLFLSGDGLGTLSFTAPSDDQRPALTAAFDATLGTDNKFTFVVPPSSPLLAPQVNLNITTGIFTGRAMEGGTPLTFQGAVVNSKTILSGGLFVRGKQTGAVQIAPRTTN